MKRKHFIIWTFLALLLSCKTQQTIVLTSETYDKTSDITTLIQIPYGNINIPGKWIKYSYNNSSRQTLFKNKDSITIAVTKIPKNKYSFYKVDQSEKDFVNEFYKWDSEYFINTGLTITKLADNSEKGFIIWKATSKGASTVLLFGTKNNLAYNLATMTHKWTDRECEAFLLDLYGKN